MHNKVYSHIYLLFFYTFVLGEHTKPTIFTIFFFVFVLGECLPKLQVLQKKKNKSKRFNLRDRLRTEYWLWNGLNFRTFVPTSGLTLYGEPNRQRWDEARLKSSFKTMAQELRERTHIPDVYSVKF